MRILLTHEQADFDALASLLGAWLLDDDAYPVLPRRMNRNVRAFVTLYGAELPFLEARDLPGGNVESVTLVDTQAMVTVKGVSAKTPVKVIDHHPPRADLPAHWEVISEQLGATVTLFVEALEERDTPLSMVQATLLLLGIYEDTGSLTYSRTTARDLQCAAYLVGRGANLRLAVDFLNHPLSLAQQALYEALRVSATHHHVHGHTVVVAVGDAHELDEELSAIAHKLRDLFDPDALIVLATTRSGVQMIARSTTDHIDVAQITAYFGGGGHDRAAAALIRDRTLDEVQAELIEKLPNWVCPAVTVAQIMSPRPQVLTPATSVQEAALRMQRFGYEGFPVVQDGKVVGLLTRRSVDRAIAHQLKLTVGSLMDAGEVTVTSNDSIEHLQRVMADTGWGQVPVVRPESGEIIGIVTRTDLLKTLNHQVGAPAHPNLASKLEASIPPGHLALLKMIAQVAHDQHMAVYVVGGFVRDLLLERPSLDFDIVVEGDAIVLAKALAARYGGRVTSHHRFGTAKWHLLKDDGKKMAGCDAPPALALPPSSLDLISARTEFYTHPTALPTVERGSIKLDLHRRDFTINTLALRLDGRHYGELHDYWGGFNDLRRGIVRVLHSVSFVDDPTRMLRAVRFEQRFGFQIEARTLQLLHEAKSLMGRVSGERIRHELDHILQEPRKVAMMTRLDELGLLKAIHADLVWDDWLRRHFSEAAGDEELARWGVELQRFRQPASTVMAYAFWVLRLPLERARSVLERLKLPRAIVDDLLAACGLWQDAAALVGRLPSEVVTRLEDVPPWAVYIVYRAADDPRVKETLQSYVTRWAKIVPLTTGDTLRARGLPPGPRYRAILTRLRNAWLDGVVTTPEEEAALLEELCSMA